MAKQLEAFVKEYAALMRELDSAALQLKESEQRRAEHDDALRGEARALAQRVGALRAGGAAVSGTAAYGTAAYGSGLDAFKTDPEVRRILGSLDERLARAQADGQHDHGLAAGAWRQTLERAAGLEKELAAEIAARQKQLTNKTGLGNKSVPDMVRLQTDMRKKLAPRRAALQAGEQALLLHSDPEYFRKKRDEWIAAAPNAAPAAGPTPKTPPAAAPPAVRQPPKTSPAATPPAVGQPPKTSLAATPNTAKARTPKPTAQTATAKTAAKPAAASTSAKTGTSKGDAAPPAAAIPAPAAASPAPTAVTPSPAAATPSPTATTPTSGSATPTSTAATPGDSILTAAAFKVAGKQARVLFAAIRTNATAAGKAARSKNRKALSGARTKATQGLRSLEPIVRRYELARQKTGDAAIVQLRNGRQILSGIKALVAVRAKARAMVRALAKLR